MKTKEIDVWITNQGRNWLIDGRDETVRVYNQELVGTAKAKLIIEIPECKKMLSESEVRDALKHGYFVGSDFDDDNVIEILFGEQ